MSVSDTKLLSLENFIRELSLSHARDFLIEKLTLLFHVSMWIYINIYSCKDNETIVDIFRNG